MKNFSKILAVLTLVLGIGYMAMGTDSPLQPWFQDWLSNDSSQTAKQLGKGVVRQAHGKYKFASNGGGTVGTAIPLGVTLPANAKVQRAFYYVTTALSNSTTDATSSGGTNTAQIGCGTGAQFKAASNKAGATSSGSFVDGIQTGTAATMTSSSTACEVSLSVASYSIGAGEFDLYIDYVMPN